MSLSNSNFDLIFADDESQPSDFQSQSYLTSVVRREGNGDDVSNECFHIIRNVLSMLNGVNAETVKKNPNDIFMLLKYNSDGNNNEGANPNLAFHCELSDQFCQLIIRIGSLGKLLLKILSYLNYYNLNRSSDSRTTYPMFDDAYSTSKLTLGNIKQYFINSVHQEIKMYHYHLLMIESKFRVVGGGSGGQSNIHLALRRILLWTDEWLDKFLFLSDLLKSCLDLKGVSLLNAVHEHSQHGHPMIRHLARGILHQVLKPFIGNVFDWLLTGEVQLDIGVDYFIRKKDKETLLDVLPPRVSADDENESPEGSRKSSSDEFEWRVYEVNPYQMASFMSRLSLRKIYFIGNAVRLLRYMLKEEYDAKFVIDVFAHSHIQLAYDALKKFVYKHVDNYGASESASAEEEKLFFEHPLVDEFDLLLDAYYEVINEEMFKLLAMSELSAQFETQLGYVLMQRGDFYESLIDYLLPLLRKPASEVVNIVSGAGGNTGTSSMHQIFNMFLVNAKLIELAAVYRIDSLLYNNSTYNDDFNESLVFRFAKKPTPLKHHLGWDIFTTRYRFTKSVYCVLFEASCTRYERLFRQLFQFKRVLYDIRVTQRTVSYYLHRFSTSSSIRRESCSKLCKPVLQLLTLLHFLLFHMFGFISRMYQHFGSQIASHWSAVFAPELSRKQKNIEKFVRAHERFLSSIESIVFFGRQHAMMTAFGAVNDSVVDFTESFAETELFPTLATMRSKVDFEELQTIAEALFRHQFKVSIAISKYRCTVGNFIALAQEDTFEFKYDILNYGPCLDRLFTLHNVKAARKEMSCPTSNDDLHN